MSAFGPTAFGPTVGDRDAALARWEQATDEAERVAAAIELAKHGDFVFRDALLDMLVAGIADEQTHDDAQRLLLSTATASIVDDTRLVQYATSLEGRLAATFAGSGDLLLARDSVPLYLSLAQLGEQVDELRASATDSVMRLTGVVYDDLDDDLTLVDYGHEAMDVVGSLGARYIINGASFTPASTAKLVVGIAMKAHERGRPFGARFATQVLATWSGILNPVLAEPVPSAADVRALTDYALTLSRLPWRPGVKYFYGHDVDGGPGLRDAAA